MAVLDSVLDATKTGVRASAITGKAIDAASAAGYGAWVNSVTGEYPTVVKIADGQAKVVHTPQQVRAMQKWIDAQVFKAIQPGREKPSLQIEFGPIINPVALKYGLTFAAIAFLSGWFARGFIK